MTAPVITIDGPSGSGKGTISHLLAQKLGWHFLDSGALYRILAYKAKQTDLASLLAIANKLDVRFVIEHLPPLIMSGKEDITHVIRSEQCGNAASKIAVMPEVRQALLERQRAFAKPPGLVADGRDMGTVVFPNADLKIYLDADCKARAQRRYQQLKDKGEKNDFQVILKEIAERDKRDKTRQVAPLKPATDAIVIDTTAISIEQVFQQVLALCIKKT